MRRRGVALVAAVACAPSGVSRSAGPSGDARFERVVYGVEVRDSSGAPFDHPFLGGLNLPRPQLVDADGDGDLDLFLQEYASSLWYFERTGQGDDSQYRWRTDSYQNLAVGDWYRFGDMDADGDLDLLTEEPFSYLRYYRNESGSGGPAFALAADTLRDVDSVPLFSDRQNIPNVTDLDCDGLLDLFIGRLTGTVARYEEVRRDLGGIPRFRLVTERFEELRALRKAVPRGDGGAAHD